MLWVGSLSAAWGEEMVSGPDGEDQEARLIPHLHLQRLCKQQHLPPSYAETFASTGYDLEPGEILIEVRLACLDRVASLCVPDGSSLVGTNEVIACQPFVRRIALARHN